MKSKQTRRVHSIGEAAAATGLSVKAIRHYEVVGLIPKPRRHDGNARTGGNRLYNDRDLARLRFVRQARLLDLSIEEIRQLLEIFEQACPGEHPDYYRILHAHLEKVTQRIAQLSDLRKRLASLLSKGRSGTTDRCAIEYCDCLDASAVSPIAQATGNENPEKEKPK